MGPSPPKRGKGGIGHSVILAGSSFVVEKSPPILGGRDILGLPFGPRVLQPRCMKIVIKTRDGESAFGYYNRVTIWVIVSWLRSPAWPRGTWYLGAASRPAGLSLALRKSGSICARLGPRGKVVEMSASRSHSTKARPPRASGLPLG